MTPGLYFRPSREVQAQRCASMDDCEWACDPPMHRRCCDATASRRNGKSRHVHRHFLEVHEQTGANNAMDRKQSVFCFCNFGDWCRWQQWRMCGRRRERCFFDLQSRNFVTIVGASRHPDDCTAQSADISGRKPYIQLCIRCVCFSRQKRVRRDRMSDVFREYRSWVRMHRTAKLSALIQIKARPAPGAI